MDEDQYHELGVGELMLAHEPEEIATTAYRAGTAAERTRVLTVQRSGAG